MKTILILTMLILVGCSQDDGCNGYVSGHGSTRLVAFGDSQTAGHHSESSKGCGYSYANILAVKNDYTLLNWAVGGSMFTSDDQYGRIMRFEFKPSDRVIFSVGFNDMSNFNSNAGHLNDLKAKLIEAIKRVAPQVHSLTIGTAFKPFDWRYSSQADLDLYRQTVRDAVAETGFSNVKVGDTGDAIAGNPAYYTADQWHYNVEGQKILAQDFELIF